MIARALGNLMHLHELVPPPVTRIANLEWNLANLSDLDAWSTDGMH